MAQGRSTKIISMIKWIRTGRLSIKNSFSGTPRTLYPRSQTLNPKRYPLKAQPYVLNAARVEHTLSKVEQETLDREPYPPNPATLSDAMYLVFGFR